MATTYLSLEQYRSGQHEHAEYWFGKAIPKAVPTWLHAILQILMGQLLTEAGYHAGSELELRMDPDWQPKPDVAASLTIQLPYQTEPIDIVVEILSPEDRMTLVFTKCRHYQRLQTKAIFVLDPEQQIGWQWSGQTENLERIQSLNLPNGQSIGLETVWQEMQRRLGQEGK